MTTYVYEVLESVQPHGMGWPEPPPRSHGLYASRALAEAKVHALAHPRQDRKTRVPGIRATSISEREVHGDPPESHRNGCVAL